MTVTAPNSKATDDHKHSQSEVSKADVYFIQESNAINVKQNKKHNLWINNVRLNAMPPIEHNRIRGLH